MKGISAGSGLGIGVKDYRVAFVFQTNKALARFLDSCWSGSAQTDVAAKAGENSGAYLKAEAVPEEERKPSRLHRMFASIRLPRTVSSSS
jgi:lipid-binding SYLF domain-containing protein